jgi:hypothetical protein
MVEAVRTTASPAAIWAICIVAVACLAFWLIMISYADKHPYVRHRRLPEMPGPVLGGVHLAEGGRSVAPGRELPAVLPDLAATEPHIPAQRTRRQQPAPTAAPTPAGAGASAKPATAPEPAGAEGWPQPTMSGASAEPTAAGRPAGTGARPESVPAQRTAPGDAPAGDVMPGDAKAEAPTEPIPAQRPDAGAEGADTASDPTRITGR